MSCTFSPRSYRDAAGADERGSVFLELSLVLPLLALLVMGAVDLGQVFVDHVKISQVAYEGARLAAKTSGLETPDDVTPGRTCSTSGAVACCTYGDVQCPTTRTNHALIHNRTYVLLLMEELHLDPAAQPLVRVTYDPTPAQHDVTVTVSIRYQSYFGLFGASFPVTVNSVTPYLY